MTGLPERIVVVGAGTMGRGIVETAAVAGLGVDVVEPDAGVRGAARDRIARSIEAGIRRGKVDLTDPQVALDRIAWHAEAAGPARDARFVIEAVPEDEGLKTGLFDLLDAAAPPETILASNTSSLSITKLGAATGRPDRVVGMHFFNPVPVMEPVEIVRGLATSDETVEAVRTLATRLGKQAFAVADAPGFAVNRILMPLINEAAFALQEGVADAGTIDALMKLGCRHPMGPLELADFVGLDVCLSILRVLQRETGDPKFRPCPLLVRLVDAGRLGRKSGRGFHTY